MKKYSISWTQNGKRIRTESEYDTKTDAKNAIMKLKKAYYRNHPNYQKNNMKTIKFPLKNIRVIKV